VSYSNKTPPIQVQLRRASDYSIQAYLEEEGLEYIDGKFVEVRDTPYEFDLNLDRHKLIGSYDEVSSYIKSLQWSSRFLANYIWSYRHDDTECSNQEALRALNRVKAVKSWWTYLSQEDAKMFKTQEITPHVLGIIWDVRPHQLDEFLTLWRVASDHSRTYRSCFQISGSAVLQAIRCKNLKRLPLWVKKVLIESNNLKIDQIGDIWKLIPAAKAWKWEPRLPKRIAVRVGKMEPKKRLIAKYAWKLITDLDLTRQDYYNRFWISFNQLCRNPLLVLEEIQKTAEGHNANWNYQARQVELLCGLPYKFIEYYYPDRTLEYAKDYLNPEEFLKGLFGCVSKPMLTAFKTCRSYQLKWAIALAPKNNPDVVVRFLTTDLLDYTEESVGFLQSLGWKASLRMLTTKTYRYRGEDLELPEYLVRDTGMLFNNLINRGVTPVLGRVRCWLTVHEDLGRQYVAILPNETVKVPEIWEPVDGLCGIDGDWSINLPRDTATLKYWGETLHNCVGGYGPKINSGQSVVFVVYVNGELKYCVEASTGDYSNTGGDLVIQQFSGSHNSYVEANNVRKDVTASLVKAGLILY
jgi:hypothetical protein